MKTSELRAFNLVQVKGDAKAFWTVMGIDAVHDRIYLDAPRDNFHGIDKIKPIPLTPEWFQRFGFMFEYGYHYKDKLRVSYDRKKDVCELAINLEFNIASIKYVHQLQNLYFSLTQTELILKP